MNKSEVTAAGFAAIQRSPRRLIANIQGMPKVGKTHLAMTAKKPVGYIAVEIGGDEGVADQFIPTGSNTFDGIQIVRIRMADPVYPNRDEFPKGRNGDADFQSAISEGVQSAADEALQKFYDAYYASLKNFATTVVDTGSDLWEIARLANFGRLEKVPQLAYTQLNKSMDKIIDDAFSSPGSVLFLHHMKEKWESVIDEKTGKERGKPSGIFDMAGYGGMKKKVQLTVELWREDLQEPNSDTGRLVTFKAQIIDSRHSADAIGTVLTDKISWADIGTLVTESKRGDWE